MNVEPTVFLVDPDGPTRDAVRNLVYTMNYQCEVFSSGQAFMKAFSPSRPGCVVLEVRIPDLNGLSIQHELNEDGVRTPVVFLASRATVSIAVRAMRAGAIHFLEKPLRDHELWETIQEAVGIDEEQRALRREAEELKEKMANLTSSERDVLNLIGQGLTKKVIASEMGISIRTVELRQTRLIRKLHAKSKSDLIRFALVMDNGNGGGLKKLDASGHGNGGVRPRNGAADQVSAVLKL